MSSTRSKNTPGNYYLEEKEYNLSQNYALYPHSQYGSAYHTQLPGVGLLPAQIPGDQLSNNAADIESFLFGINSTNLVTPAAPFSPELKTNLCSANIFKREATYIPEPLIIQRSQRPFPV